ncbi:MAG: nickel pincer cofactor biosynthesis protein LarC [Christensenellales bacterium]|jgi:uncharacterized protein (TIGR00299 family) protein
MKTLYIECGMGAAGDMLTAALLELLPDRDGFIREMNELGIPNVRIEREASTKCGICGTHIRVTVGGVEENEDMHDHHHDHHHDNHHDHDHDNHHDHDHNHDHDHEHSHDHGHAHSHNGMREIEHIVEGLKLSAKVREDVLAVYTLIAEAESRAHGVPVSEIHFHEVGAMDAIADISAVCLLMEKLAPEQVIVSPIHVGSGHVKCAHGILPVPAPATAYILRDVPIYGGGIRGELCTPTGAALLKHFATSFGEMPIMKVAAIGYGMGKKDFEAANCVRAMLGETADARDTVYDLSCNVDDMTAEEIGFATERLFEAGALEVFTVPAGMKKSRPGVLLHVLCRESDREQIVRAIFTHSATIGIRETTHRRYVLDRTVTAVSTPYGDVRRKDSVGYGMTRSKYEYDDLARIACDRGISIRDAERAVQACDATADHT